MQTSPRSTFYGIFVLALSIIVFEIALTRVFAIMMWHHFTYLVVSVGLLGFGAAGSILTARRDSLQTTSPVGALSLCSLGYGISVVLAFLAVTSIEIDSLEIWNKKINLLGFSLVYLLIAVPFLLGGMAIGMALTRFAREVNKLYFFDLLGSACGAAVSVVVLASLGSTTTVMFAAFTGLVAAVLFSLGASRRHVVLTVPAMVLGGVVFLGFAGGQFQWRISFAPGKELRHVTGLHRIHSATAEVEVTGSGMAHPGMGGDFGYRNHVKIPMRFVGQDGTAPTFLFQNAARIQDFGFLSSAQAGTAYQALEARGGDRPKVLVIGVGGGVDVMVALRHAPTRVTAVEINSAMIEMVQEHYDDYLGGLFRPGAHVFSDSLNLVQSEGRSHLRHSNDNYDIIQMSGVDSFTALSSGAYALSESYLYTVEAIKEFYEHLEDNGYINYSRFILSWPKKPRETLRLANIAWTALTELGLEDAGSHIAVFRGRSWASTMIRRGPFTRQEIEALQAFAFRDGFAGLVFNPLHVRGKPFPTAVQLAQLARQGLSERLAKEVLDGQVEQPAQVERVVDELLPALARFLAGKPEAYEQALGRASAAAGGKAAEVAAWARKNFEAHAAPLREEVQRMARTRSDFEVLLRGDLEERQHFIDGYEYDITACTDDKPFFFNYYRWAGLLREHDSGGTVADKVYHPDFPVGHMVLLASLIQIVVFAFCLIILPLRRLARAGIETPGSWRYFCFFAALGMGFMFVEISMMQKMIIFLGHPTYALSVVLASILGFAGLGSLVSGRLPLLRRRNLHLLTAIIVVLIIVTGLVVRLLLPHLLGFSLAARIAMAVIILMPTAFVLGMPFPLGIRMLERRCPQLLPWGWAINGFLSVFSSIFCVVLSMAIGFTWVFLLAAAVYLLGMLAVSRRLE